MITRGVMPSACPAVTWPLSTPSTPDRKTSAMNVASLAASASAAAVSGLSVSPMCGSAS